VIVSTRGHSVEQSLRHLLSAAAGAVSAGQACLIPVPPQTASLMPMRSEKSHDTESDQRHQRAESDHNNIEDSHDAPKG
jgi:hypothetical protein